MNIVRSFKRWQHRVTASGSPFRYLRKCWVNVSHPTAGWKRARAARPLFQNEDPWFRERLNDLEINGFAWTGAEIDPVLLAELDHEAAARLAANKDGVAIRPFFTELIPADLPSESIFVRFALQPAVLKVASAYLGGQVPVLSGVQLLLSHGENFTGKWQESQLWHRDYDDARMVKFWVYFNDVEKEDDGPFTFLPAPASRRVPNTFFPGRVSDETVAAEGLTKEIFQVYGKRLKPFYIDTGRCYHLGSRLKPGHTRYGYVASFVSHAPLYPAPNGITLRAGAPEMERLAVAP